MSKLDFKSIYENIQLEKEYGITNEEDEKKESSDKKDSKENKTKVTPESIIKDMMKFEPAQLLKFVAQQEDSGAKTWLLKNLIPFVIYAVKNNYIKAKALGSAIKNIGDKNKDDETGIDYDNVEIEESSIKTVYAFDDETIEKLQKFINEYKKEMEAAKDDIETSSEELSKDIKKSGVKIEGEKLADNALTIAGVIDNEENKGKSGKELTKIVDQKIEAKKEIKEIEKNAEEIKKLTDKIKVDPKYEKMSPEELDKLASKDEKKTNKDDDDSKLVKELSEKVKSKIGKDYKSSVIASIFDGDEFRKFAKQLGFNLAVDKVAKAKKIAGCRVDYYDDEASDVVAEGDSGWKINILKGDEKNKGLKKITDYIEKQMKAILKDKLGKIYKIRRRWAGDNPDGEFDSIFVFAEYKSDVKESISEANEMVNEAIKITPEMVDAVKKAVIDKGGAVVDGNPDIIQSGDTLVKTILQNQFPDVYNKIRGNAGKAIVQKLGMYAYALKTDNTSLIDKLENQFDNSIKSVAKHAASSVADKVLSIDSDDIKANIKVTGIFSRAGVDGYKKLMIKAYELKQQGIEGKEAIKQMNKYLEDQSWFNNASSMSRRSMSRFIETSYNKSDGILGPKFEKLIDKAVDAKQAAKDAIQQAIDKTGNINGATMVDIPGMGRGLVDSNGNAFIASNMFKHIDNFDNMLDDGSFSPDEYKQIAKFEASLQDYLMWAEENANSEDPTILAKVAQIKQVADKFDEFQMDNFDEFSNAYDEYGPRTVTVRIPEAGENGKNVAKLADNEETKEVTKGWLGKAGKVLRVFGQAKVVAKFGKFVLNQGKEGVDAIGGQYVKFKEDQNVIAEMKFILMNAKDSSTKHSDTKFSVRFDTSDLKWHLTNLDDRKAKIEKEDVLMKKILDTKECKEFKKECLDNWTKLLQPKDEANKFVPYFIKNYDKLGVKITDKNQKKYFDTLKKLVDNFDEVKKQFA